MTTTITAELIDGFQVDISNGRHTWRADEPLDLNGTDTGPNPYDLLLGALAACTTITLSMYAQRKGIKIDSMSVSYSHDKVHVDDCDKCDESHSGYVDQISSQIFVDGDFDDDVRKRLGEIAQRCPVHKTLENDIVFSEDIFIG